MRYFTWAIFPIMLGWSVVGAASGKACLPLFAASISLCSAISGCSPEPPPQQYTGEINLLRDTILTDQKGEAKHLKPGPAELFMFGDKKIEIVQGPNRFQFPIETLGVSPTSTFRSTAHSQYEISGQRQVIQQSSPPRSEKISCSYLCGLVMNVAQHCPGTQVALTQVLAVREKVQVDFSLPAGSTHILAQFISNLTAVKTEKVLISIESECRQFKPN